MKKMSNKVLLVALGAVLFSVPVRAQVNSGDGGWTLIEAINYAKQNNLQIKRTVFNRDLSAIELNQARMDRLPRLNGSTSSTFSSGTTVDPTVQELRRVDYTSVGLQANATVPLFMGFQQTNLIKQHGLNLQASEQDILTIQDDITLQIITSYLNILFAEELMKTAELQLSTSQQQLDRTKILFKAGSVAENAVLDLESQVSTNELDIINAQNQRDISRLALIQLLNLENKEAKDFKIIIPELPEPDTTPLLIEPNTIYDVASQIRPALKAAELRVLSSNKALDVARGAYYPRLSLSAGINTFYNSRNQLFDPSRALEERRLGFTDENGTQELVVYTQGLIPRDYPLSDQLKDGIGEQISLNLNIPIFNGFMVRNNVQRAKIGHNNAKLNADIERNQLRQTIEQSYVDALAAQRKYTAAKQQLIALEKNYKNAELRLNSGVINTVDFNVISTNYRTAQSNVIQAKYEYTFKLKVLDFYQGKDLSF